MLKRIPPPLFWLVLVGVVFALGFRIFAAMQPEDEALDAASTTKTAAHVSPSRAPGRRSAPGRRNAPEPRNAPGTGATATAVHPSQTVALAPQTSGMAAPHWASDGDFTYSGHWEHVARHFDGRTNGTSSRSFRPGSRAVLTFSGRFVRLYGVVGPGGGLGTVDIDGRVKRMVDFYAATKSVHKLVFGSPPLEPGTHRLTLSVIPDQALPVERSHYVNIDGAEIGS